ncbi:metallophosphoesterase [Coprobacter tertius]|uniref:Metallophosphoesterase n=1 Tax=Coprobacter tertius TaxID=2944915 RepID=A0ABT1MIM7_9BACT|nr:metallophosphoesterase [Coprobacter tertius]MCP9612468.1 metallophosphoesterase [Coprobacter tertius]
MKLLPLVFILLLLFNVGVDYYIYRRIILRWMSRFSIRMIFWGSSILLQLGFLFMSIIIKSNFDGRHSWAVMWFLFIYFTVYMPRIGYFIVSLFDYLPLLFKRKKNWIGSIIGGILGMYVFGAMLWGAFYDRTHPIVHEVVINSEKLPASFDGYKIVQFSDTHLENYGRDTAFISRFVDEINALQPDLILFTGDLVNRRASELPRFMPVLSRLKAHDGVWSVLGNHDYGDYVRWPNPLDKVKNLESLKEGQRSMGWNLLNNQSVYLRRGNDSIALIGVENWSKPPFPRYGDLHKAYPDLEDEYFKILMTHDPTHWQAEVLPETNIDLTLSGHTHAMQIKQHLGQWKYSPAGMKYPEWGGLYEKENRYLYVNEGTGYVLLPIRIGTQPDITFITLKSVK